MLFHILKKALAMLMQKPIRLWSLSLAFSVLCSLASVFCILPIVILPITMVLQFGMVMVYLNAIKGQNYNEEQLFSGFKGFKIFTRVATGMGWKKLWEIMWMAVPVVGIIKSYSYSFVPYILVTDNEVSSTQALAKSMAKTKGYKMTMFLSDLIVIGGFILVNAIFIALASIPYLGVLFALILFAFDIAYMLFVGLLRGLIHACIWEEATNPTYVAPVKPAPAMAGYPQYPQQPGYPQYPQQQPGYPQYPQQQPVYPQYPQQPYTYAPEQPVVEYQAPVYEAPVAPVEEPASAAFCPGCGAPVVEGSVFCGSCGQSLQ